jgi:hypothetical protein
VVLTLFTKQPALRLAPCAILSVTFILAHARGKKEGEKKRNKERRRRELISQLHVPLDHSGPNLIYTVLTR